MRCFWVRDSASVRAPASRSSQPLGCAIGSAAGRGLRGARVVTRTAGGGPRAANFEARLVWGDDGLKRSSTGLSLRSIARARSVRPGRQAHQQESPATISPPVCESLRSESSAITV